MKTWPQDIPEPQPLGTSKVVRLEDGLYEAWWRSGRRRLLAFVEGGRVRRWLTVEESGGAGCLDVGNTAQRFYADGHLEDFSPWDDNSPRYPAGVSFKDWLAEATRQVLGEPAPLPPPRPAPPILPLPPVREILKELSRWRGDLEFRTQLEFHVRDRWQLSRDDAARVAEFMPLAFLSRRRPLGEYLHPVWEGTFACSSSPLVGVDVFRDTVAEPYRDPRIERNMVHAASGASEGIPMVAARPPEPTITCPLRVLEVLCELLLRAAGADGDATEGAYLLAPYVGAPLDYTDLVLPWDGREPELAAARQRLAAARDRVLARRMGPGAAFFLRRARAARDYFRSWGAGRHAFPLLPDRDERPWGRDRWRDLADEVIPLLPPATDAVDGARLQNRLAEVGLHLSGQTSERLAEYLAAHEVPEPGVQALVREFLDSDALDPLGWQAVNGVLWVLESFEPGCRADRQHVLQAVRASRMLAMPLAG